MRTRHVVRLTVLVLAVAGVGMAGAGRELAHDEPVRTVILVRHAEKVDESADSSLSEAGAARAKELARVLADASVDEIIVSPRRRTQETAAPLAAALGITPSPRNQSGSNNAEVVSAVRELAGGETALVVGHSNTLGSILTELGAREVIPFETYDNLVVATMVGDRVASVMRLRYGAATP